MTAHTSRFRWRAMISVLIGVSFVLLVLSGAVLFAAPPGRIANWTDWGVIGLRKSDWASLHIVFSAVFLVATVIHLVFNWRPMVGYFRDRLTRRVGFRWEWAAALLIVAVVFASTRLGLPPFSSLLSWNEHLKASWDQPADRAPIPHAELLSLSELGARSGVPLDTALNRLEARGLRGHGPDTVVQQIATDAQLSAQQVHRILLGTDASAAGYDRGGQGAGREGGGGPGRKTLAQFCAEEGIVLNDALARLEARGISAEGQLRIREIADAAGNSRPSEVLEIIRGGPARE